MRRSAFTWIELIFVIIILGILAATAIAKFGSMSEQARVIKLVAFTGTLNRTSGAGFWFRSKDEGRGGSVAYPDYDNIVEQYICDVLNIKKSFFKKDIEKNRVILKFFNLESGKIKDIQGVEALAKQEKILKLQLNINKGDTLSTITTDANRHGFIIAKNDSIDIDKEINKHIKVIYEK